MNFILGRIPPDSWVWDAMARWRVLPVALLALVLMQTALWTFDRAPPFRVISYATYVSGTNEVLLIDADVKRELDKDCSVDLSSTLVDSTGIRWDMGVSSFSPQGIRDLDAKSPGKLRRRIQLPPNIAPGTASVLSSMVYRCNPIHDMFWPIFVQTQFDFEVKQ